MARQITYANDSSVSALDRLTGIDSVDRSTKNFTIEAIAQLFASTGLADVSKLAFFYDYNASTSASSRGQAYYGFIPGLEDTPVGINSIVINRFDSLGKDFEPLRVLSTGSHIKLTAVGNAADTNYGLYEINGIPQISGSTITITVKHLASSGTLPNDEISIALLASSVTGQGVAVTDGTAEPTQEANNGDIYFQILPNGDRHDVFLWLYKDNAWVNEANISGIQGEQGIQGFQGVGIVQNSTANGDNTTPGLPTTFVVSLSNPNPNGPQGGTLSFTVPAGAMGLPGDNIDGSLLNFSEDTPGTISVTYDGEGVGNFPAPTDGTSVTGLVEENTPAAGQTTVTITSDGTPMSFVVQDGANGDTIAIARNTADNGITVTSSGGDSEDVLDGADGTNVTAVAQSDGSVVISQDGTPITNGTINQLTATDVGNGVRIDQNGTAVATIINGSNGLNGTGFKDFTFVGNSATPEVFAVGVTFVDANGVETIMDLGDITNGTDGTPGVQGTVTFRFYRDELFAATAPVNFDLPITDTGNFTIPAGWTFGGVPTTYDSTIDNLWIAEYEWNPANGGVTPTLIPILLTGPQGTPGTGSGTSDVDGIVITPAGNLAVDEGGTALVTNQIEVVQGGSTNNDKLVSQGYVDTQDALDVKLTPGANQIITQELGTVLDVRGSFDLEDNAGGKSFDFSGTSGDIHIEDNGDIKLYFDKSSGKVFYDDTNTGTLSTATVNELATQGDISSHGTSNVDDVVIDAGRIKIDEGGTPTGTGIELATGTADNDKITTQGYVDDNSGDVNRTPAQLKTAYESNANTNAFEDLEKSKLAGIENNATADQTDAEIKTAYENNANTNAFTDDDESKLDGIQAGAQVNPTALSAFMNDEGFIDLSDVPVRSIDFQRTAVEDVQILSDGTLRMHLATRGLAGFTYGFLPVAAQTVGSLTSFDITLTNVSTGFDAVITDIEDLTGFTFSPNPIPADGVQTITVTPPSGAAVGTYTLRPTVQSTEQSTGVEADHTNIHVTFQVQAAVVPPVQSDYFYFGFTNNAASPTSADDDIAVAQIADETAALDAGGFPAVSNVTREQFASGGIEVIGDTTANPFGSDDFVSFIAVPTTEVVTTGGVVTTPLFHDLTLNPMGEVFIFDYMNTVEIGTTDYTVFKQVIDSNARFRINF